MRKQSEVTRLSKVICRSSVGRLSVVCRLSLSLSRLVINYVMVMCSTGVLGNILRLDKDAFEDNVFEDIGQTRKSSGDLSRMGIGSQMTKCYQKPSK
jgi:hypothetical protein